MNTEKKIFALGFFDGVHLGHQALLARCVALAAETDAVPAAITFLRHPLAAFVENPPKLITTDAQRDWLLYHYGIRHIEKFPVTVSFMATPWQDFLEQLVRLGAVGFVCGNDFRFGKDGQGNPERLAAFCALHHFPCEIVPEQKLHGVRISSSHIRQLLNNGDVAQAASFLGHPYGVTGPVVHGQGLGRTIGIPTANIDIPDHVLIPQRGVYACRAMVDGNTYMAVTNVGSRPTVGGDHVTVEPWLLDFSGDLYGKILTLQYHAFLRPERKFDTLEELKAQIMLDARQTRHLLSGDGAL